MQANKKDKFARLLKQAETDLPKADLTASVMNFIEADLQRESALKQLLQQQPAEGPSFDFTAGVMAQINPNKKLSVYKPIISQKLWYGIAAMLAVFIGVVLLGNTSHPTSAGPSPLSNLLKPLGALSPVYFIVIAASVCMLMVDYLLTRPSTKNA